VQSLPGIRIVAIFSQERCLEDRFYVTKGNNSSKRDVHKSEILRLLSTEGMPTEQAAYENQDSIQQMRTLDLLDEWFDRDPGTLCQENMTESRTKQMTEGSVSEHDTLLSKMKAEIKSSAANYVPMLCEALKEKRPDFSNREIRRKVQSDCSDIWTAATVQANWPEWVKTRSHEG